MAPSRWADSELDAEAEAERKREKEEKKRLKSEKARALQEEVNKRHQEDAAIDSNAERPAKRRKSQEAEETHRTPTLLRHDAPEWGPCRHISNFDTLNHIAEGTYGWVSRAKDITTAEVVALKKLKRDIGEGPGLPITGLREIQCLRTARHKHVVNLREIVVGNALDDVFLVMDFVEHDLKTLQEDMQEPFLPSEIKTLLLQLGSAVDFLHNHWILHRDLKTSNILMNNRGEIKLADFGMARYYQDPPLKMTQLVVTLWYRAPELLLGVDKYGPAVDIWSLGCIFAELLTNEPLFQGKNEVDQLAKVFTLLGMPSEETWPGVKRLPNAKFLKMKTNQRDLFSVVHSTFPFLTKAGSHLLSSLLALNPYSRPSADQVLAHEFFTEDPRPKATALFPTFPSRAGQEKRRRLASPSAPRRGNAPTFDGDAIEADGIFAGRDDEAIGGGFQLKLGKS